jgi:biopolymer transport protein ExbB
MDLLLKAGPLLWPILLCSIVGLAIFLDRAYVLFRQSSDEKGAVSEIVSLVSAGKLLEATALCRTKNGPVSNVVGAFLRSRELPTEDREQIVAVSGDRELHRSSEDFAASRSSVASPRSSAFSARFSVSSRRFSPFPP